MSHNSTTEKNGAKQLNLLTGEIDEIEKPTKPKGLSRRNFQKHSTNPFVDIHLLNQLSGRKNVYYTQTDSTTIIDLKTQEIEPVTTQIVKSVKADKEQFVKIFTTHLKSFFELNQTAYKMLQYVLYTVQNEAMNSDKVYLNLNKAQIYFKNLGQNCSSSSYYLGMKTLVEKAFIAETTDLNVYYINAKLFFNGDRIEFITKFEIDDKKTLEQYNKTMKIK